MSKDVLQAQAVYVSVILPVYNEIDCLEPELRRIHGALTTIGRPYEVIVVDDASTDGSLEVAVRYTKEHAEQPTKIISRKKNRGTGTARRIGTQAATGEIIVWTDVDMTYPNDLIPEMLGVMEQQSADQIVGARHREMGTHKFLRAPAKLVLRKLAEFLTDETIPDLNSGLRAFRRDIGTKYLPRLPRGFSCVTTLTMSFLSDGHTVVYFPIEYKKRVGKSKFDPVSDTARYLRQIVVMAMSYRPLKIFAPISVVVFLIGVLLSVYSLLAFRYVPATAVIAFGTSLQILAIGLLADLVVRLTKR
jgi:glycosyltransferase involved in cell wall biosynthesis